MNGLRDLDIGDTLAAAGAALSRVAGETIELSEPEQIGGPQRRNLILRCRADRHDGPRRSVIVKATRAADYDVENTASLADSGLVREWIATTYLAARAPARGHGAALLAADATRGLLVIEDLGADLDSLVKPLLDGCPAEAENALTAYASALGRLHADTAGCAEEHVRLRETLLSAAPARMSKIDELRGQAQAVQGMIGGSLPDAEIDEIGGHLERPGAWAGLVHGDPCPDNALIAGGRVRLIDFEFTAPGHVLLDGLYWRLGFPTCWCAGRIPPVVAERVETVYRAELSAGIPLARDDHAYQREAAVMAAAWLLRSLHWRLEDALREDKTWGVASVRSRLVWYLDAVADMTAAAGILPGVQSTSTYWRGVLGERWPGVVPLPLYPAFAKA